MRIIFTKYAIKKLVILKEHEFTVTRDAIQDVVENPDSFDLELDPPKIIVKRKNTETHDLRVVYLVESDIIKVVSFYPAEKDL